MLIDFCEERSYYEEKPLSKRIHELDVLYSVIYFYVFDYTLRSTVYNFSEGFIFYCKKSLKTNPFVNNKIILHNECNYALPEQ